MVSKPMSLWHPVTTMRFRYKSTPANTSSAVARAKGLIRDMGLLES